MSLTCLVYRILPLSKGKRILVACGPGNNGIYIPPQVSLHYSHYLLSYIGGDGLVAARHLHFYGYTPIIYYPKPSKSDLFNRLHRQLTNLSIPFTEDFHNALANSDLVIDAIFGFSFSGAVREPFPKVIEALETTKVLVLAVDAPSSWNIEGGPPKDGPGAKFMPDALISLTAPKPLVHFFKGRHFLGGRYVSYSLIKRKLHRIYRCPRDLIAMIVANLVNQIFKQDYG